jgi:hypothetical protein
VTLDGRPLPKGRINFIPPGALAGGKQTPGSAVINNGRFSIPRSKGLIPDKYRVEVYSTMVAGGQTNAKGESSKHEASSEATIPAKYNAESELMVEIKDVNVKEVRIELDSK